MKADFDQKMHPRFMGIPTFMRTPLQENPEGLDIALVGIPYDGGVTNRPGARHGPREIRNMSTMSRSIHHVSRVDPYSLCAIADVGDVPFSQSHIPEKAMAEIETFFSSIHAAGAIPLSAGGDHSVTYPIFRAVGAKAPVGMIHIDAHTDTWDAWQGNKFNHGAPFRRAVEDGVLDPKRTVQIGIRGAQNFSDGWDFSLEKGMRVIFMEEFTKIGIDAVIAEARRVVGDAPTYISFDVDGLDPVYAPGTGTPEIGGITTKEAQALLRGLSGLNLIGGDVVEVAPPFDPSGNTALVGATMMYEILCLLAESVVRQKKSVG
ncbi:MAG: Guanidinopropionase [Alphaproteobacteria bacterium MarineAlpha3_Bin5]|nr:agmatinase [Magnetovibrio sp.]PPR79998.1 MAG: Guanidinopropionase [Alphaproteobacteria bacterium MarineAlpha3_Bin5]|tara:strand:+ start:201 stop:1157 length:957 start_codon:yes stop_codon:yes gene_type:complete